MTMSSDSDDDMPLAGSNGNHSRISKSDDRAMDTTTSKAKGLPAGLSIRHGPVDDGKTNGSSKGNSKRKARASLPQSVQYKDESGSDDDAPMAKRRKSKQGASDSDDAPMTTKRTSKLPPSYKDTAPSDDSSDDDKPLGLKLANTKAEIEKDAEKEAKALRAKETKSKSSAKRPVKDESSDDDAPLAKAPPAKRQSNGASSKKSNGVKKAETKAKATPIKAKAEESVSEDEEETNDWWNQPKPDDDTIKWTSLQHGGVAFPPEYERLPKNVKLVYDGKAVELSIEAEEAATFFGSMLHSTENVTKEVFQQNFFNDFKEVLAKSGGAKDKEGNKVSIKDFNKLDFQPIFAHYQGLSEARKARSKAMNKEERKAEKEKKEKAEEPYQYCIWSNRKEKVGNFRVEPPGLFRGRGEHPKTGRIKKRVQAEQITINIGEGAKVPTPPAGHSWKAIQHDNKATWLAMWQENINGAYKYVMLAANSSIKGQADLKKFEKARELKKHIDHIRKDYTKKLKSEIMAERQMATAMYLIDKFALRAGNEKDTDNEADTVGCCSLKYEHLTLKEPETVIFDFLGKDSIRYYDEVTVERQVFKNLKMFKKPPKEDGDDIFDRVNTSQLNKHLSNYMVGLTAKVFRTYNASYTMSKLLQKLDTNKKYSLSETRALYNDCNREVAILCNHKRTVGASHDTAMGKLSDRIKGLKYQQWRLKISMLELDPKLKKKKGVDYFQREQQLDSDWVIEHQAFLVEEQKQKITKKFEKDNEKKIAEKEKPMPDKELKERLKAADELEKQFKKENKSGKVEPEGKGPTVEKIEANIKKLDGRISDLEAQARTKDDTKDVALGTSKINYIDPRLTVVFSVKFKVPIDKFFSKTLRDKFNWAIQSIGDDDTWEF